MNLIDFYLNNKFEGESDRFQDLTANFDTKELLEMAKDYKGEYYEKFINLALQINDLKTAFDIALFNHDTKLCEEIHFKILKSKTEEKLSAEKLSTEKEKIFKKKDSERETIEKRKCEDKKSSDELNNNQFLIDIRNGLEELKKNIKFTIEGLEGLQINDPELSKSIEEMKNALKELENQKLNDNEIKDFSEHCTIFGNNNDFPKMTLNHDLVFDDQNDDLFNNYLNKFKNESLIKDQQYNINKMLKNFFLIVMLSFIFLKMKECYKDLKKYLQKILYML